MAQQESQTSSEAGPETVPAGRQTGERMAVQIHSASVLLSIMFSFFIFLYFCSQKTVMFFVCMCVSLEHDQLYSEGLKNKKKGRK